MLTPPLILDEAAIEKILPCIDIRAALEQMFQALGQGQATQPPQLLSLFPDNAGDFITYLGVLAEKQVFGAKLSPYIPAPAGATGQAPLVTAWTLLMSMQTGMPLLLCDAKRLTTERTAATTALAVDLLARPQAKTLAIIGTGSLAQAHLRYVETLRPWERVRFFSPRAKTKANLPTQLENGCPVEIAPNADAAIADADVVLLCTSSGTPVIDCAYLSPHALVTSISTNVAHAHEISPNQLENFDVYCDYRQTAPLAAGEMRLALDFGTWQVHKIKGDLPELLNGLALKPDGNKPAFFRSIGLGLEDIAAAVAILNHVNKGENA